MDFDMFLVITIFYLGDFFSFVLTFVSQFEANPMFKLKLCPQP